MSVQYPSNLAYQSFISHRPFNLAISLYGMENLLNPHNCFYQRRVYDVKIYFFYSSI